MPVLIPVANLAELHNPFECSPWGWGSCSLDAVTVAIQQKRFESKPNFLIDTLQDSKEFDIARIAYLVETGWSDPINIDVGVPALGCYIDWMITDGNHRLGAAIYRKDEFISAVVDGDINYAFELFGVDVTEVVFT